MIEVTRLNGNPMLVNSDLIKIAEASPDTMLTLIHGEKLIVRESCEEIVERVMAYRARLLARVADQGQFVPEMRRLVALAGLSLEPARADAARTEFGRPELGRWESDRTDGARLDGSRPVAGRSDGAHSDEDSSDEDWAGR